MTTLHANDATSMLDRLCQLIEKVEPVAPRQLVAQAVGLCVHMKRGARHPTGRSLRGINSIVGLDSDGRWQFELVS